MELGSSVYMINDGAFAGCTGLRDVYFRGNETQWRQIDCLGSADKAILNNATIHYNSQAVNNTIVLSSDLELSNISYSYSPGGRIVELNEGAVGGLRIRCTANGPATVCQVRIADWYDKIPSNEQINSDLAMMERVWKRSENSLASTGLPLSSSLTQPVYQEQLGKTTYALIAALDESVNVVGYAVVRAVFGENGGKATAITDAVGTRITSLYPAHQSVLNLDAPENGTSPVNFADGKPRVFFNKTIEAAAGNRASLDFSKGTLCIYRAADGRKVFEAQESAANPGTSNQVLLWGSGSPYSAIRLEGAKSKLDYGIEYYVTIPEGFIRFADGSTNPAVGRNDWAFFTAGTRELKISLPSYSGTLSVMSSMRLSPTVSASGAALEWESSNPAVATVDNGGYVTTHRDGTTRITCRVTKDGQQKELWYDLTVTPDVGIKFDREGLQLSTGQAAATLGFTYRPVEKNRSSTPTLTVTSSNPGVISVDELSTTMKDYGTGSVVIRSVGTGAATVTATITYGGVTASTSCNVCAGLTGEQIAALVVEEAFTFIGCNRAEFVQKAGVSSSSVSAGGWCAQFIKICAERVGAVNAVYTGKSWGYGDKFYEKTGTEHYRSVPFTEAQVGDIVHFNNQHVGIVCGTDSKYIYVVHGNWHRSYTANGTVCASKADCGAHASDICEKNFSNCGRWPRNGGESQGVSIDGIAHPNWSKAADSVAYNEEAQRLMKKLHLACPVEAVVTYNGEMLDSAAGVLEASFGYMEVDRQNESIDITLYGDYDVDIAVYGTDSGEMSMSSSLVDEEGGVVETRSFENVPIEADTVIQANIGGVDETDTLTVYSDGGETFREAWSADGESGSALGADEELTQWCFTGDAAEETTIECRSCTIDGETINMEIVAGGLPGDNSSVKLMIAVYEDGKMIEFKVILVAAEHGTAALKNVFFAYDSAFHDIQKMSAKVFLLDTETSAPLCASEEIAFSAP